MMKITKPRGHTAGLCCFARQQRMDRINRIHWIFVFDRNPRALTEPHNPVNHVNPVDTPHDSSNVGSRRYFEFTKTPHASSARTAPK